LARSNSTVIAIGIEIPLYSQLAGVDFLADCCPATSVLRRVGLTYGRGVWVRIPMCAAVVPNVSPATLWPVVTHLWEVTTLAVLAFCADGNCGLGTLFSGVNVLPPILAVAAVALRVYSRLESRGHPDKTEKQKAGAQHGRGVADHLVWDRTRGSTRGSGAELFPVSTVDRAGEKPSTARPCTTLTYVRIHAQAHTHRTPVDIMPPAPKEKKTKKQKQQEKEAELGEMMMPA
jgi:hypothetical protein